MRSRASRITVTLALLTCLICPLVEMFDNWDHTIQTGNDTEYSLVVLALCLGVAYSFARLVFKSALLGVLAVQPRHISLFFQHLLDWVTQDDSGLPFVLRASCCYRNCGIVCAVVLRGWRCRSSVASWSNF